MDVIELIVDGVEVDTDASAAWVGHLRSKDPHQRILLTVETLPSGIALELLKTFCITKLPTQGRKSWKGWREFTSAIPKALKVN